MKVLSVKLVAGRELVSNWRFPMQIIETTKGQFIDAAPGQDHTFRNTSRGNNPGFDWKRFINNEVINYHIVEKNGFKWLKEGK